VVILAVLVLAQIAGCGASGRGRFGTVHGHVVQTGGDLPGAPTTVAATVTVTVGERMIARRYVDATGFRFELAPGRYRLTAIYNGLTCVPEDVTVAAGQDVLIDLSCQIK